jgi:predicted DNA-binding ribbon-helix-helix protein
MAPVWRYHGSRAAIIQEAQMHRTTILVPREAWREFTKAADDEGMPAAQLIRRLMKEHLAERKLSAV